MKFNKIASAQQILRQLHEKQAGYKLPLLAGAALIGGAHVLNKSVQKGQEYKAGFQPGYIPQE
jgi:hypothetical protein